MNYLHKIKALFALALCLTLAGCGGGTKQEAADSEEEATVHFLTNLQNALVNSGMVSGSYQGNMADGKLSLSATISESEKAGMTSSVTPVYEAEK